VKKLKFKPAIRYAGYAGLLFLVSWATFSWLNSFVANSDYFRVEKVQIVLVGRVPLTQDTIKRLLTVYKNRSIFEVDLAYARDYILSNYPEVRTVVINRILPDKLVLTVRPRRPVAQISMASGFCLVDAENVILPGVRGLATGDLPIIAGIDTRTIMTRVGRRYDSTGLAKALRLIEVMNQMKFHQDHEIHMIDVSDEQNLSMFIEGGIEIKIGGEDFRNRLAMLNKTFETGRLDKSQIKYIDLRFGNVIIGPR
jgi:cell division septal protein FtsQ